MLSLRQGLYTGLLRVLHFLGYVYALVWGKLVVREAYAGHVVYTDAGEVEALEASQVFALGDCLSTLALAEHNHRRRCMGHYNKRHTLRTFMVVHEKILGAPATAYTEELHRWFTRGLSKRSACVTFPASDARSFRESVTDLQAVLGSDFTVTWSTVFVLRCETRQVCQTYGIGGVQKMAHAVHRGKQDIRRQLEASLEQAKSKLQASCQRKLVTLLHCPR